MFDGVPVIGRIGRKGQGWELCTKQLRKMEDLLLGYWLSHQCGKESLADKCLQALQSPDNALWLETMKQLEQDPVVMQSKEAKVLLKIGERTRLAVASKRSKM